MPDVGDNPDGSSVRPRRGQEGAPRQDPELPRPAAQHLTFISCHNSKWTSTPFTAVTKFDVTDSLSCIKNISNCNSIEADFFWHENHCCLASFNVVIQEPRLVH